MSRNMLLSRRSVVVMWIAIVAGPFLCAYSHKEGFDVGRAVGRAETLSTKNLLVTMTPGSTPTIRVEAIEKSEITEQTTASLAFPHVWEETP